MRWVRKEVADLKNCSIWCERDWARSNWGRSSSGFLRPWTAKRTALSTSGRKRRRERAQGVHVAWRLWQQAAACPHARRRRCAGGGRAGQSAELLIGYCRRPYLSPFLSLCKNRPKVELKPNCHQNKSCAKICELQNMFWWPKPILSGN